MSAPLPVFRGTVTAEGKLVLDARERAQRQGYLKRLAGQPVVVVVKVRRNQRSLDQNKWWWGVAIPLLALELGYDKHDLEDLHYALVAKCFGTHVDPILKEEIPSVRSSQLTTTEFSELMEWAVRWAASEYGIVVPLPGESA